MLKHRRCKSAGAQGHCVQDCVGVKSLMENERFIHSHDIA